ncbi:MAG: hypothetical protein IKN65_00655 [Clostridia bacterium]|nr:hypothetical protein [Bacilli bacterium]MBR3672793.1 hypothetical protein [Clostridia bacterium]
MEARIYVNPSWTFKDVIEIIKALKQDYYGALALFDCFNIKDKVDLIRKFKQDIYSLKFEEWKRDRVWDYLNDNIEYEIFDKIR